METSRLEIGCAAIKYLVPAGHPSSLCVSCRLNKKQIIFFFEEITSQLLHKCISERMVYVFKHKKRPTLIGLCARDWIRTMCIKY